MDTWQERFVQKLDTVRNASRDRFECAAKATIGPVFEEFREFATQQDLRVTAPLDKPGIRTFKFAVTENAYVFMTFRPTGLDECEIQSEFFVPHQGSIETTRRRVPLTDADASWARSTFEQALDQFLNAFVETLARHEPGGTRRLQESTGTRELEESSSRG